MGEVWSADVSYGVGIFMRRGSLVVNDDVPAVILAVVVVEAVGSVPVVGGGLLLELLKVVHMSEGGCVGVDAMLGR